MTPAAVAVGVPRGRLGVGAVIRSLRRGFGGRVVARVGAERDFHARAGRVAGPESWSHLEIAWLTEHADAIDRGVESHS